MTLIREATYSDIPAIARVHVDTWRSAYSGIVPEEVLTDLSYDKRENALGKTSLSRRLTQTASPTFAEDETGRVIGFLDGGRERTGDQLYQGEINAIYILSSHQHRGIGRELVRLAVEKL